MQPQPQPYDDPTAPILASPVQASPYSKRKSNKNTIIISSVVAAIVVIVLLSAGVYMFVQYRQANLQADVLIQFKQSMSDPSQLSSWKGSRPCKGWKGIYCSNRGQVTIINMTETSARNALTSIPKELSVFKELQALSMRNMQLTGTLPPELSKLETLNEITLGGNYLTGTLPASYSTLSNLMLLELYPFGDRPTAITGTLPPEYFTWQQLLSLTLVSNKLTGTLPHEYGLYWNPKIMLLGNNSLSGSVPSEYENWYQIAYLMLTPQSDDFCVDPSVERYFDSFENAIIELPQPCVVG
eukprot:TRINITY_DN49744_c0_g2_i1.p1 TRINITY_DN49744_c0_g2~~TRINITY_DN49744_c0_g2_i1.p1  ORF type:complete len:326 (-),score=24.05 TRINITY_DN49744_c0_g2_i1:626-1519(-)